MKKIFLVLMIVLGIIFSGCTGNNAEQLFETAKLEELQNNLIHAKQLYQEIIEKYPDTAYAEKAKIRLSDLKKSNK